MDPKIYIAFRFHGNFYHSYRGDTPDELGFGKDIRIISRVIQVLDEANQRGIPIQGTWDFENYFSLERIMPAYCPELIEALQRRAAANGDEFEYMSYNNGWINAHTAQEFAENMARARSNAQGSGLVDLFGTAVYPMVRPQEMMFTPIHLKLYRAAGIQAISLYYSGLPFNGFSNFIPKLGVKERYNPLTLTYPGIAETLTLLPCYNVGDLADHVTLRRWVKSMRKQQLALADPGDLLLLIDHDADDSFWVGFAAPGPVKRHLTTVQGLPGLLRDLQGLDYVAFTTPGRYLQSHAPVGTLSFGQDTADGSFDGLASWAEKWSNHRLATGLERARILELQARRLAEESGQMPSIDDLLNEGLEARLKLLSTTHFGMAAPVMNLTREGKARDLVRRAVEKSTAALARVAPKAEPGQVVLVDYCRGVTTDAVRYVAHPSRGLVRLALRPSAPATLIVRDEAGEGVPVCILPTPAGRDLLFVADFAPEQRRVFSVTAGEAAVEKAAVQVRVKGKSLQNDLLWVLLDECGQVVSLQREGRVSTEAPLLTSAVTYAGKTYTVEDWHEAASGASGGVGYKRLLGSLTLKDGYTVSFERELVLAAGLPYLYVTTRVSYPRTPDHGFNAGVAERLQQAWDNDWQEVLPCEIRPGVVGAAESPLRVWKHNACDHVSSFRLDYGSFSANRQVDSANNAITQDWVAVSNGSQGFLLAQTAAVTSSFAFCPLRTRAQGDHLRVRLNPFGSYWGRQYHYGTAATGLGQALVTRFSAADHIKPYAPSYNGRTLTFSLMLAPYDGDAPAESLRWDAEAFAYPYAVFADEDLFARPAHRGWQGEGLGEKLE